MARRRSPSIGFATTRSSRDARPTWPRWSRSAESIRAHGVLQPIVVIATLDGYQLIAGERRLRAAQMAGLERIPATVREADEQDQLELALVENLQRTDLNPIEAAAAFRRLIDEFGLDQDEVASRVGRARSSIANTLRLLDLAEPVQAAVASGQISEGHARAIAGLTERLRAAHRPRRHHLGRSLRAADRRARAAPQGARPTDRHARRGAPTQTSSDSRPTSETLWGPRSRSRRRVAAGASRSSTTVTTTSSA